jgi:hypothetical protein
VVLAPQAWALFIDDVLVATDLAGVNAQSTGDSTFVYVPGDGATDIWWLSGTATPSAGVDYQIDNVAIHTGSNIRVIPEASMGELPWEADGLQPGDFVVSPWFGGFEVSSDGWLLHAEMGWLWVGYVNSADNLWLYSYYWDTWLWSTEALFPAVYATNSEAWLYYFILPDRGAYVYDFATSTWSFNP